jgi:hypothetical protein
MGTLRLLAAPALAAAAAVLAGCCCPDGHREHARGPGPYDHRGPRPEMSRNDRGPDRGPGDFAEHQGPKGREMMPPGHARKQPGVPSADRAQVEEMRAALQHFMERVERLEVALKQREAGPGPGRGPGPKETADAPRDERFRRAMEEMKAGLEKREARIHELENMVEKLQGALKLRSRETEKEREKEREKAKEEPRSKEERR